jgi:aromatic-L-amino-acid decarboxylase
MLSSANTFTVSSSRGPTFSALPQSLRFGLVTFQVKPASAVSSTITANKPNPNHEAYTNDFTPSAEAQYKEDANQATKQVYEAINAKGDFYLSSTVICGTYAIRVVSANTAAEEEYLKMVFDQLVQIAEEQRSVGKTDGKS